MTFPQALQLAFIVLKLMGYITWSWWIVMTPAIILFVFCLIQATIEVIQEQRQKQLWKRKSD